ncbi:MAG: DUF2062 domain-containing protein [Proteobacteria bacterium]|jgi:uncharacterized protein (DUF2062 family)|nr:DUF2062 domain-containing protein [Pseudomonadota bacterium]
MIRRHIQEYIRKFHELLDAKDAPHSVAGGTAIGVFFGFIPIFGLKTVSAMGVSLLTRCSVVASVIGVSLHDILIPIWPLILRFQFQIGFWLLSHPHHFAPPLNRDDFKISELLQWDNFVDIGLPLLVGGIVFAIPFSLLSYGAVLLIMNWRQKRRALQAAAVLEDRAWEKP